MKLPYLICEIGLNHQGSMDRAVQMIQEIAHVGRDYPGGIAAKFQAVFPETLCTADSPTYFHQVGEQAPTQRAFFERSATFTPADYKALALECAHQGIDFLCTPFDVETIDWLNPLVKAWKIASADLTNVPLLKAVGATQKPVYLSTGASTKQEIAQAVSDLYPATQVTVLHCVLSYPTPDDQAHLGMLVDLGMAYAHVGYSDHTIFEPSILSTAWLLGAEIIEKHYTFDKTLPSNDHYHAADMADLRSLIERLQYLQALIGEGEKHVLPCEHLARKHARRGLYAARHIPAGKPLEPADIAILRPSARLGPERYRSMLGLVLPTAKKIGEAL